MDSKNIYRRLLQPPSRKSFFLFGPRGTGKTTWLKIQFPKALYFDLLDAALYNDLLAHPEQLSRFIPPQFPDWIILDEVQRIPALLHEVHRLIEAHKLRFILTGSSARKLKKKEVNLLAGRALLYQLYPLTAQELGKDFSIEHALRFGHLPATFQEEDPKRYLESYVMTYLREEVQQEGLTRSLDAFSRFLETASFSQGQILNISEIGRECAIHRKVVEHYFSILEDLLIATRLPVFTKKAKRKMIQKDKFYFFDTGIYHTLRPTGPLDAPSEQGGIALESLVFQELRAINAYQALEYKLFYWRTVLGQEVDFVLYGPRGLRVVEVKQTAHVTNLQLRGLKALLQDYPQAKAYLVYGGTRKMWSNSIQIVPVESFLRELTTYL